MQAALPAELELVLAMDLVQVGAQVPGVERILQDGKGLRTQCLAAHRLISVAERDIGRGEVPGRENVLRQAERGDGIEVLEVLCHAAGVTEAAGVTQHDVQHQGGAEGVVVVERRRVLVAEVRSLRAGVGDVAEAVDAFAGAPAVGQATGQRALVAEAVVDLDVEAFVVAAAAVGADPVVQRIVRRGAHGYVGQAGNTASSSTPRDRSGCRAAPATHRACPPGSDCPGSYRSPGC